MKIINNFIYKARLPFLMEYESMLNKAREALPEIVSVRARFEIPEVKGHVQGNKTLISNFIQICSILHRNQAHVLKYLLKELATSGDVSNSLLVLNRKVLSENINQKIRQYANTFVLCPMCGKPDTKIILEKDVSFLKCQACGAKRHIKY
jgi:translation initiation factor 2 subunit 2